MKSRRLSVVSMLALPIMIVLVVALVLGGCAEPAPAPAPGPAPAPAPTLKTLKIGALTWLQATVDFPHGLEILADMENTKGGIDIGGDKYKVEFIVYDNEANQSKATAAVNRLIFEDKVNFILSDPSLVDSWLPITEANKVVACAGSFTPPILSPNNHYAFQTCFNNAQQSIIVGWFIKKNPDKKSFAIVCPDNVVGHIVAPTQEADLKAFGISDVTILFYPTGMTDLSAIGTKIKSLNPDVLIACAGGPQNDALVYKAASVVGWKGQILGNNGAPAFNLSQVAPIEALEGFVAGAWPVEFDPVPPEMVVAKEFKAAYIAKYGKWDYPEVQWLASWSCLRAGLQKAGTLDTDKVAAVIGNGLEFEGPIGFGKMISRPDFGNNRTIDSYIAFCIKKVVNGKVTLFHTMSLDEALGYFKQIHK